MYRFKIKPGREADFVESWSAVTVALRDTRGALGSRLHRSPDGLWYAYAQWPSAEARRAAFEGEPADAEASARMRDTIEESLPDIVLEPVSDYLILDRPE